MHRKGFLKHVYNVSNSASITHCPAPNFVISSRAPLQRPTPYCPKRCPFSIPRVNGATLYSHRGQGHYAAEVASFSFFSLCFSEEAGPKEAHGGLVRDPSVSFSFSVKVGDCVGCEASHSGNTEQARSSCTLPP